MTRDTAHGTKGSSIVRALAAAVLIASMFGLSTLTASAQDEASWWDSEDFEVPTALEVCEDTFEDGVVSDASGIVEDALADSDLPPELVDEIVELASAGDFTCQDLFGEEE